MTIPAQARGPITILLASQHRSIEGSLIHLLTGGGDDSISITSTASSSATAIENSELSTGEGDDPFTAEAEEATAIEDSEVRPGWR